MSETLIERIKYISSVQPDYLLSAFASDLNEIVTRAEAAEARAAQLESELDLANAHAARLMDERDEARNFIINVAGMSIDPYTPADPIVSDARRFIEAITE